MAIPEDFSNQGIEVVPSLTVSTSGEEKPATHAITVETANLRGGELRDYNAGIWLALFDREGKCALNHVVGPREGSGQDAGEIREFDRGTRESFAISASGLGDVEKIWIGPGASTWLPERITVESLSSSTTATFRNNAMLGERQDIAAAELKVFDPEANDQAVFRDNTNYAKLRQTLLLTNLALVSLGSGLLYLSSGGDDKNLSDASTFGAGGAIGFAYLLLLSSSVASIGKSKDDQSVLEKVFTFPATRFLLVLSSTYWVIQNNASTSSMNGLGANDNVDMLRTIVLTVAGLLMYKASVLLVSAMDASFATAEEVEAKEEQRED